MTRKTKSQLEAELTNAWAQIAHLECQLKEAKPVSDEVVEHAHEEDRLRQLLESLPVGISVLDGQRKVVFQNSALSHIVGINAEGLRSGAYKDRKYLAADGMPMAPDQFASAQAEKGGKAVYNVETGIVKEDGQTIWTSVCAIPVNLTDWKTVVVTTDITQQKQAEVRMRDAEALYRALFETSLDGLSVFDARMNIVLSNRRAAEIYGFDSPESMVGRNAFHFLPPEEQPRAMELARNRRKNSVHFDEFRLRRRDGSEFLGETASVPIPDQNGNPTGLVLGMVRDITERKHAERELARQAETLREQAELLEHAHVLIRDLDDHIVLWNTGMEKLYGWKKDEAIGQVTHTFFQTEFPISLAAYQTELMQNGVWEGELTQTRKDGTKITVSCHHVLYRDPSGNTHLILEVNNDITTRKQLEADLRQSRENFARAFTSNPAALAITERDTGKFITTNEAYTKIMGYEPAEVIGRTVAELNIYINPNERPTMLKQIDKQGRLRNYELWVRSKSGDRRGLMVSMEPIYYDGKLCILSTFLDITERKMMEMQLNESERSYRELVQNANSAIIRWKTNGEIAFFNEYAQTFFGYTAEEAVGKPVSLLLPEIDSSGLDLSTLVQSIAENPAQFEKVINENICHDGRRVWMAWTNKPVYDPNGSLTEILAVGIDITERKRAEDELRSSQKLLRDIIDNTSALVYILDRDGRFLLINRQLEKIFGLTTHQIFGRTRADFVSADLAKQHRENDLEIFNSGQGNIFEEENMQPDGRHVYLTTKFPLFDPNGDIYAICGISTDMTIRKQMEEELRRSNAELEQFAYIASHDLQEPLRAVAGMVQLLQKRYRGQLDERADEYIAHAVEAAGRMQALIQALLAYSRVDRLNQSIEQVDAQDCIKGALKNLNFAISESHAIITASPLPRVDANPLQLTQLFQNLIGNAIKFRGDAEPQILISAIQLKDAWQFSVRDNGIGIEPQYFERIFLIFQRLHTRREYDGTGIGLAMCKKIVERHGGRIWVESEPGRGSTFHFTLPMRSH